MNLIRPDLLVDALRRRVSGRNSRSRGVADPGSAHSLTSTSISLQDRCESRAHILNPLSCAVAFNPCQIGEHFTPMTLEVSQYVEGNKPAPHNSDQVLYRVPRLSLSLRPRRMRVWWLLV